MMLTGLSGNELYCLATKGWAPGKIVVGNSVYSLGFVRSVTSGFQTLAGGELGSITELISDGRHAAIKRMEEEASHHAAHGMTGVTSDLKKVGNLMEFLAIGSSLQVWPAAGFPLMAKRNGATLVIINREATEFDDIADLVVRQDIGTVLEPFIVH